MPVSIEFDATTDRRVSLTRVGDVTDAGWAAVTGTFASALCGRRNGALIVSTEAFLSRLQPFAIQARSHGFGVTLHDRLQVLVKRLGGERQQRLAVGNAPIDEAAMQSALGNTRFRRALKPFQVRDLAKLATLPHGANFSVPGAGKTTVAYALYELLRARGVVEQLLVIAPLSAFSAWKADRDECFSPPPSIEVYRPGADLLSEIVVCNYHRLASDFDTLVEWLRKKPTHVVLDEAHRVKRGRAGQHGTAVLNLSLYAGRRDILTGTPAPQAPSDFVSLVEFLWPGQSQAILPPTVFDEHPSPEILSAIASSLKPLYVRTTKRELELPPTEFIVERLPLSPLQRDIYQCLRSEYVGPALKAASDKRQFQDLGRVLMYLLEAATNPLLLPTGSADEDARDFVHPPLAIPPGSRMAELLARYGEYETPQKLQRLSILVRESAQRGEKVLVWTNFVRNIRLLERTFADLKPAVVHGGVPPIDSATPSAKRVREVEVDRFLRDPECSVLLANPAACGEGVSLHSTCHHAIYLDRTFNAGMFLQSQDRIHRLGLKPEQVTRFTVLLSEATIDEVVDTRLALKVRTLGALLEDPALHLLALPAGDDDDDDAPVWEDADRRALLGHIGNDGTR